jgi:hypothetical protein
MRHTTSGEKSWGKLESTRATLKSSDWTAHPTCPFDKIAFPPVTSGELKKKLNERGDKEMLENLYVVSLETGLLIYHLSYEQSKEGEPKKTADKNVEPMQVSSILFSMMKLVQTIAPEKNPNSSKIIEFSQVKVFSFSIYFSIHVSVLEFEIYPSQ